MARTFSGIVALMPELEQYVHDWRARYDAEFAGLPAHVTVLTPWIAPADLTEADLDALGQLLKSWQPFEVSFDAFGEFSNAVGPDVHYLTPNPADGFLGLTDDLCAVWPEFEPYEGSFAEVIPHLTLSTTASDEVAAEFQQQLSPRLPIRARVTELAAVEIRHDRYSLRRSFRLGSKKKM